MAQVITILTDAEIFEMLNKPEPNSWKPNAAVLVIEHRKCSCGTVHDVPSGPFAEYKRKTSHGIQTRLSPPGELPPSVSLVQLPRRTEHVTTTVDRCQFCFKIDYDGTQAHIQLHLFPNDPRTYSTYYQTEAEVNGVPTTVAGAVITATRKVTTSSSARKRRNKQPVVPSKLSDF